jgi:Mn2+/Fe2+ NRAMP family transporter
MIGTDTKTPVLERKRNPFVRFLAQFGPGMIWAMVAIGQTHVILSTYAGARFGFSLLWVVILAHLCTYPVFEYGPRYAVATGESLIGAYTRIRRMRTFMIIFFGILLLTVPFLVIASLLSVTASILLAAFPQLSFNAWCLAISCVTAALIFAGRYKGLEFACIAMSGVLVIATVAAFFLRLPQPQEILANGLIPAIPAGSMLTLVALIRMPTDPATSIMHSVWAVKKREEWIGVEGLQAGLRKSIIDLRVGFAFSLLIAFIFLSLGAVVLHPRGINLEGLDIAIKLSQIYTQTVGSWTFPLFIGVAFIALWGSYYANADGVPRMFEALYNSLNKQEQKLELSPLRSIYTAIILGGGLILAIAAQRPVFLVLLAVSAGLIAYPMIYLMNIYAVTKMVEKEFRPSRFSLCLAWLGVAYSIVGVTLLLLVRVLGWWN